MDDMTRREALRVTMAAGLAAMSDPIVEGAERVDDRVVGLGEQPDSPPAGPVDENELVCVITTN